MIWLQTLNTRNTVQHYVRDELNAIIVALPLPTYYIPIFYIVYIDLTNLFNQRYFCWVLLLCDIHRYTRTRSIRVPHRFLYISHHSIEILLHSLSSFTTKNGFVYTFLLLFRSAISFFAFALTLLVS